MCCPRGIAESTAESARSTAVSPIYVLVQSVEPRSRTMLSEHVLHHRANPQPHSASSVSIRSLEGMVPAFLGSVIAAQIHSKGGRLLKEKQIWVLTVM